MRSVCSSDKIVFCSPDQGRGCLNYGLYSFLFFFCPRVISCISALQLNRKASLIGTEFVLGTTALYVFLKVLQAIFECCYIFSSPLTCLLHTGLNNSNYCTNTKVPKQQHSLQGRAAVKIRTHGDKRRGRREGRLQFKVFFLREHNSFMCIQDSFPCCLHFHCNKIGLKKCLVGAK